MNVYSSSPQQPFRRLGRMVPLMVAFVGGCSIESLPDRDMRESIPPSSGTSADGGVQADTTTRSEGDRPARSARPSAEQTKKGVHLVRVAAIQMLPATGEPNANVERATRLVREAVEKHGAQLIILPETTLTGYASPSDKGMTLARTREMAEPVPGPSVNHFARLAAELKVYIIWGLHERNGDRYHNAAVLLSPKGEILGTYRKVHINKYENNMGWTNGDHFQVWPCEIDGVSFNLGIMICFDREVPEAARCLAVLGADIIAIPQATGCTCDVPIHRDQLRVRAYENEVYIAMANWAGPVFKGHSMIIDASGEVIRLGGRDEEILDAVFDMDALRKRREHGIYGRHHRQPGVYGPLLER